MRRSARRRLATWPTGSPASATPSALDATADRPSREPSAAPARRFPGWAHPAAPFRVATTGSIASMASASRKRRWAWRAATASNAPPRVRCSASTGNAPQGWALATLACPMRTSATYARGSSAIRIRRSARATISSREPASHAVGQQRRFPARAAELPALARSPRTEASGSVSRGSRQATRARRLRVPPAVLSRRVASTACARCRMPAPVSDRRLAIAGRALTVAATRYWLEDRGSKESPRMVVPDA